MTLDEFKKWWPLLAVVAAVGLLGYYLYSTGDMTSLPWLIVALPIAGYIWLTKREKKDTDDEE